MINKLKNFSVSYFIFLALLLSLFSSGIFDSQDGFQYLAVARNIYYQHEPTAPPYEYDTRQNIHMSTRVSHNGKTYSVTGLGYSLALVPGVAITDQLYKLLNVNPPTHFPLENDWVILLIPSFTNAIFGAFLGLVMYKYLRLLEMNHNHSVFMSLSTLMATNMFVLSKHMFPHMMFSSFLLLTFYLIKKYSYSHKISLLYLSGLAYGVVIVTYNKTFLLTVIPLLVYFITQVIKGVNKTTHKKSLSNIAIFVVGALPLYLLSVWYDNIRVGELIPSNPVAVYTQNVLDRFPITVFFEALYGQLFSPGRSMFIYSPILLIVFIFWSKIKKNIYAELVVFTLLFVIYISFYSTVFVDGGPSIGITGLWHGESSWGPRYLSPIIPFGMLVVGHISSKLKNVSKKLILYPLLIMGVFVNLLGVLIPYQVKFQELDKEFFINRTEYTVYTYTNFLPRYSPIIMSSKKLYKTINNLPNTTNNGPYNVRFYDGIDFPFNVGEDRWRAVESKGYILFDNQADNPIDNLGFTIINHQLSKDSTSSARLNFHVNDVLLDSVTIDSDQTEQINIVPLNGLIRSKSNELVMELAYDNDEEVDDETQIVAIKQMTINNKVINLESIDTPYVSDVGRAMGHEYKNWGGENNDPWKTWHIHTQVYERTLDFWWLRPIYYWDIPNWPFYLLFGLNIIVIIYSGKKCLDKKVKQ